jgi:hypothetical protein
MWIPVDVAVEDHGVRLAVLVHDTNCSPNLFSK